MKKIYMMPQTEVTRQILFSNLCAGSVTGGTEGPSNEGDDAKQTDDFQFETYSAWED